MQRCSQYRGNGDTNITPGLPKTSFPHNAKYTSLADGCAATNGLLSILFPDVFIKPQICTKNDTMPAIFKVGRQIKNPTSLVDAYLLEEQSCQISPRSDLK